MNVNKAYNVHDVSDKLSLVSFTFIVTYVSGTEAAVRPRCADNPVDV